MRLCKRERQAERQTYLAHVTGDCIDVSVSETKLLALICSLSIIYLYALSLIYLFNLSILILVVVCGLDFFLEE